MGVEDDDSFFHCDFILFRQLLPRSTDEGWFSSREYTSQYVADYLTMHEHPLAKRLKLVSEESLDWIEIVNREALKSTFLSSLRQATSRMNRSDHLVIIINGHGIFEISEPGCVLCESDARGVTGYLAPQEVILATLGTPGSITIIVNSCYL